MSAHARTVAPWGLAAVLVAAILAGQAAADSLIPPAGHGDTGLVMGRSGFAFVTGMRTFAAAVLWGRLDAIDDRYYATVNLGRKKYLLPTIRLVTQLDPQFEEPYYAGPFILYDAGDRAGAFKLAEDGIRANPRSGVLHGSYAQLLLAAGRLEEARRQADTAITLPWSSEADEYNLLVSAEVIFRKTGAPEKAAWVVAERARLWSKLNPGAAPKQTGE